MEAEQGWAHILVRRSSGWDGFRRAHSERRSSGWDGFRRAHFGTWPSVIWGNVDDCRDKRTAWDFARGL